VGSLSPAEAGSGREILEIVPSAGRARLYSVSPLRGWLSRYYIFVMRARDLARGIALRTIRLMR
jgi:hypothetical protein